MKNLILTAALFIAFGYAASAQTVPSTKKTKTATDSTMINQKNKSDVNANPSIYNADGSIKTNENVNTTKSSKAPTKTAKMQKNSVSTTMPNGTITPHNNNNNNNSRNGSSGSSGTTPDGYKAPKP